MKSLFRRFFDWYERHKKLNILIATALFITQLVHLYWLATHVISLRLTGQSHFDPTTFWETVIIFVDYFEIPAIISASLLYLNDLRQGFKWKPVLLLVFLNSQWLHIFWITDEFVLENLTGAARQTVLPGWLAWVALGIDYLELPVIYDTLRRSFVIVRDKFVGRPAIK